VFAVQVGQFSTGRVGQFSTGANTREFKERSLAIAVELGIEVRNRELADQQRQLRHERDGRIQRPTPRMPERNRDRE